MKNWSIFSAAPIYLSQIFSALLPLIIAPLVIKKYGLGVFGHYAALLTISQLVLVLSEYSFDIIGPRLIKKNSNNIRLYKKIYTQVLKAKVSLIVLCLPLVFVVSHIILRRPPELSEFLGHVCMLIGTATFAQWYLISTEKTWFLSWLIIFARAATIFFVLFYLVLGIDLKAGTLYLLHAVPWALIGLVVLASNIQSNNRNFDGVPTVYALLKHGGNAFVANSGGAIQNTLGAFFVGAYAGTVMLGVYSAIDRVARTVSAALKPIFQTMYPHMISVYAHNPILHRRRIGVYIKWFVAFNLLMLTLTAFYGDTLLKYIYGSEVAEYSSLLTILVLWLCFGIFNNILGIQGLLPKGKDRQYSAGIWACVLVTVIISMSTNGFYNYIYWVGAAICFGEMAAFLIFCIYFYGSESK